MDRPPRTAPRTRSTAGWGLLVVVVLLLVAIGWAVHRLYEATASGVRETVSTARSVVTSAGQAVQAVNKAAESAQEALRPGTATRDPVLVEAWLKDTFRIAPPPGYVGAFGLRTQLLGQPVAQLTAVIPKGASARDIFSGSEGQVRFSPGPHTIFIAARYNRSSHAEMQEAFAEMEQADRKQPYERVFIVAGGRRVAALRGSFERHGRSSTAVAVFLDGGRMLYAAGPKSGFDDEALVRVLAALVEVNPADDFLYAHATAQPRRTVNANDPCGVPGVRGDFDVVAIGVQRGSVEIAEQIDMSGRTVAIEEVVVGATPNPVVLILAGESPVVWKVGRTPGARIAGVLAQGRYRQAVIGLPDSIPMTSYSGSDGPNACPHFVAGDRSRMSSHDIAKTQARVTELFGRGIDELITRKANQRFQVGAIDGPVAYAGNLDIRRLALPDDVMPGGHAGLDWLVKHGKLRPARPEELDAWRNGYVARTGHQQAIRDPQLTAQDTYVVLAETRVPYLAGADSRVFVVPPDVPMPAGERGHSSFLMMDGFRCVGTLTLCRR